MWNMLEGGGVDDTEGRFTYFLKAAATPLPQEPFVLQASVNQVSGCVVEHWQVI